MIVIQITGGRKFNLPTAIYDGIKPFVDQHGVKNVIIRHGGAKGADQHSHFQARRLGIPEENIQSRPVSQEDWARLGKSAGNARNIAMLDEKPIPDIVLAFPDEDSRGTWNMIEFAQNRNIPIMLYAGALSPDNEKLKAFNTNEPLLEGLHVAPDSPLRKFIVEQSIEKDVAFGLEQELTTAVLFADEIWPGSQVSRLPEYSDLDFAVTWRGELKAFLEIKARRISVNDYNTTILPLRKHTIAKHIFEHMQIQTFAIIVFTDAMVSFHLENEPDDRRFIKRDDRDNGMAHAEYSHGRFTYHLRKGI